MNKQEAMEVFDGLMLGDGGLCKRSGSGGTYFDMALSKPLVPHREYTELVRKLSVDEHLKYLHWIADNVFRLLDIEVCEGHPKIVTHNSRGKDYLCARLTTRGSLLLPSLYDEWYSGGEWATSGNQTYFRGAIKVLPDRLLNTLIYPISTLAHFFLGDGSNAWTYQKHHTPRIRVSLSTCNFSVREVCHLVCMLNNMGISTNKLSKVKTVVKGSGLVIWVTQSSANLLINLIKPKVLEIFQDPKGLSYKYIINQEPDLAFDALVRGGVSCD